MCSVRFRQSVERRTEKFEVSDGLNIDHVAISNFSTAPDTLNSLPGSLGGSVSRRVAISFSEGASRRRVGVGLLCSRAFAAADGNPAAATIAKIAGDLRAGSGKVGGPDKNMQIKSATFLTSAPDLASCPASKLREFAFIGRSNVGKSSLLNMLAGGKALARVSATPGHTQLINFFTINKEWTLVDLPGYGYAKHAKSERDRFQHMIATFLSGRENIACVFVLIDSMIPPQQIDLEFVQWLMEAGVPFVLVFTKADRVKPKQVETNIGVFQGMISAWGVQPRVFTSSAKEGGGRKELLAVISEALAAKASE